MSGAPTRSYVSAAREAGTRQTRRAIVAAAAETFAAVGYSAATIDVIAERAGVSRRTVFSSVGGKAALLKLAVDWAQVGDDEPVAMVDRAAVEAMSAQSDPEKLVGMWVAFYSEVQGRVAALGHVVDVAADADPDVAALSRDVRRQQLVGARRFVDHLAEIGGLRTGVTRAEAADWCWAQMTSGLYRQLVVERGWSPAAFEQWLARAMSASLLPTKDPAVPRRGRAGRVAAGRRRA